MTLRFTLIDRLLVSTEIEEPVGFDQNTCEIKRDPEMHGIMFSNHGDNLQFSGLALAILQAEYNAYGTEGIMTLVIEEDCGFGFVEFSRGRFLFNQYEFVCGAECFVKVPVENANEVMNLRNKINQKVNLDSLKSFDEVTDLPAYAKLPFDLTLPSKTIFVQDYSLNETDLTEGFQGTLAAPSPYDVVWSPSANNNTGGYILVPSACVYNAGWHHLVPGFTKQIGAEIGNYGFTFTPLNTEIASYPTGTEFAGFRHQGGFCAEAFGLNPLAIREGEAINYAVGTPSFNTLSVYGNIQFHLKGNITVRNTYLGNVSFFFMKLPDRPGNLANGTRDADYVQFMEYNINCRVDICPDGTWAAPDTVLPFDIIYGDTNFVLEKGDRLFIFFAIEERKDATQRATVLADPAEVAWELTTDTTSFFKYTNLSNTPPTTSKVYAINEAISRVAESVTNDNLRLYSEYFGRTDSEPYPAPADGCGSLEVITDGLRIRKQENKVAGQTTAFAVSLQDILDGLNPIHNIGFGLEPDPLRLGFNRLRVEDWKFFYNDTLILSCPNAGKITHKCYEKEIYSTFSFGYEKWEAEEFTGLDEFLTKRDYRTTLSSVKNDLKKLSKWIASGYALEVTRRKGSDNSKDWRYDKETFIICCQRNISDSSIIEVELGNVINPLNIIDPATLYNYRISPVRNAMRWMNKVLESYKIFNAGAKIIFTDGDGNYFAAGQMASGNCRLESGSIAENQTISPANFADSNDAKPFLAAERVEFEYPMSSADYKLLQTNPYGKIYYSNDCEEGYGFIDTINFKPEDGTANFSLKPAIDPIISGCVPVAIIATGLLPDGTVGLPYSATVSLYGSQPFIIFGISKPSWMTVILSGSTVFLSGTPDAPGTGLRVSFGVSNCAGVNSSVYVSSLDVIVPTCDPVLISGSPVLPDGYVSTAYTYTITITGDAPFVLSNIIKPAWMSIAITGIGGGIAVIFSGFPTANATAVPVSFDLSNCLGINTVSFADTIDITTLCIPVTITGTPVLPDGVIDDPYNYVISLGGTMPFTLSSVVAPAWMTIAVLGATIVFSGTPLVTDAGTAIAVSFDVENCVSDLVSFSDTIDVNTGTGGCCSLQDAFDVDPTASPNIQGDSNDFIIQMKSITMDAREESGSGGSTIISGTDAAFANYSSLQVGPEGANLSTSNGSGFNIFNSGAYILNTIDHLQVNGWILSDVRNIVGDPTTVDIPAGKAAICRNTTTGDISLWANNVGTMVKIQLI